MVISFCGIAGKILFCPCFIGSSDQHGGRTACGWARNEATSDRSARGLPVLRLCCPYLSGTAGRNYCFRVVAHFSEHVFDNFRKPFVLLIDAADPLSDLR